MNDSFLQRLLEPPSYGWSRNGTFYAPTVREILSYWVTRVNPLRTRKNWLAFSGWFWPLCLVPFAIVFFAKYFSWPLLIIGLLYSMVALGTVNIVWLHRYGTHRAFTFRHPAFRFLVRNLTIRIVAEEAYVLSHHVHHAFTERPGDPYNAHGGRLYCLLAAELHQGIARDLSREDYARAASMLKHTGLVPNTYEQYEKWGSVTHPARLYLHSALNWAFWYAAFFLVGGHGLACAIFGFAAVWAVGIRDFNYDAHGCGKDKRKDGVDFNRDDLSINQLFAGTVSGEWHNNHHAFPGGARSGFLWWQLDTAWGVICLLRLVGGVSSYRDYKAKFIERYVRPHDDAKRAAAPPA